MMPEKPLLPGPAASSLHVHSTFSDGCAAPAAYAERAVAAGVACLGFSEHGPVPFASDWNMPAGRLPAYREAVAGLKRSHGGRLDIRTGIEADYLSGLQGPADFTAPEFDYVIGAVHYLPVGAGYREIDNSPEKLSDIIAGAFCGDVRAWVAAYYALLREMLAAQPPTILAHFDLVKKFNRRMRLFDETAEWYRREAFATLEALAATPAMLEVNTAPLYRGLAAEPYPSAFILARARELEIPVILTADAHAPEYLVAGYGEARALLARCGYPLPSGLR